MRGATVATQLSERSKTGVLPRRVDVVDERLKPDGRQISLKTETRLFTW